MNALNEPNAVFIEKLLWKYLPLPLTHLHMVDDIVESVYHNLKGTCSAYQNAIENFTCTMNNMEISDLFALLRTTANAPRFSVFDHYRSRIDSVQCIEK